MPNDLDLSALENFDLAGLSKRGSNQAPTGKPIEADLDDLIEDPDQPRTADNPGFSDESLGELSASIKAHGIKMPISVKSKNANGKHVINDGARRYRGARLAELKTAPIFIDDEFDRIAQLMVNLQREGNTPDEIAKTIAELEAQNVSRIDIAKGMGKNKGFVSEYAKFAQINPLIRALYDNEECRDVKVCNQLDDLLKEYPDGVGAFLDSKQGINRRTVSDLSKRLKNPESSPVQTSVVEQVAKPIADETHKPNLVGEQSPAQTEEAGSGAGQAEGQQGIDIKAGESTEGKGNSGENSGESGETWPFKPPGAGAADASASTTAGEAGQPATQEKKEKPAAQRPAQPKIMGAVNNKVVRLVLDRKAKDSAYCWVEFEEGEKLRQVLCSDIQLVSIEQ